MRKKMVSWIVVAPLLNFAAEPISPVPLSIPYDKAKAAIGEKLFFDPILSKDQTVACATCHNFTYGGADQIARSIGMEGKTGRMNSPTVLNSALNFVQFWNGRAKTLAEQAKGPIHNPVEMGSTRSLIEWRINQKSDYKKAFAPIVGNRPITFNDVTESIAEYEKTLITPNAKFDLYLQGKMNLDPAEARGYALFKRLGCASCHNGVNVGGNSYQKFGVIVPIERHSQTDDRYEITRRDYDKNVFKVPTLRNVMLTAPYFHDGRAATLPEAIRIMSRHNLGITLSNAEINDLIAFLCTLTGAIPAKADNR